MVIGEKCTWSRWAARACLRGLGAATCSRKTRRPASRRRATTWRTCPSAPARRRRRAAARAARRRQAHRRLLALQPKTGLRHRDRHRRSRRRGQASFELRSCSRGEIVTGFARLDGASSASCRQPAQVEGGVLFVDSADKAGASSGCGRRVRLPAALPGRRAGLHDRKAGRAPGHHPPRREDALRDGRRHRAIACASCFARPTARAVTP